MAKPLINPNDYDDVQIEETYDAIKAGSLSENHGYDFFY